MVQNIEGDRVKASINPNKKECLLLHYLQTAMAPNNWMRCFLNPINLKISNLSNLFTYLDKIISDSDFKNSGLYDSISNIYVFTLNLNRFRLQWDESSLKF